MSAVSDNSQEESNTPWDHFCCADNPFSGGKSFWKHQLFSLQSAHCCGEQLSLTFPEEGYKSVEVKAIPPEESLQRQRLILAAPQEIEEQLGNVHSVKCLGSIAH